MPVACALRLSLTVLFTAAALFEGPALGGGPRQRRSPSERVEPLVGPARAASDAEHIDPEVLELIDPFPAADAFAGATIRDRDSALKLIQARGRSVPKVGQMAPDFELKTADGKQTVRLSSFRGQRPVVLIFGSHT
jgi:hypothetical protein